MIKRLFALLCAILTWAVIYSVYQMNVRQRHDTFKQLFGPIDDIVVEQGFISDKQLHYIGATIGLCYER